jgi:hypothetical protein
VRAGSLVFAGLMMLVACAGGAAPQPAAIAEAPVVVAPVTSVEPAPIAEARPAEASVADVAAGPSADAESAAEPSERVTVRARLVESNHAPHCGGVHFVVVMRYAVEKVVAGRFAGTELYVAHSCPEMGLTGCEGQAGPRVAEFREGEVHRLELRRGAGSGAVVDRFADSEAPRWRSGCGNVVPAAADGSQ